MFTTPRPLSVLIVDDCPDTVVSCAELLGLSGHDARTAENAEEALALLDGWEPDVALLDLRLPGMDGFELARRLRAGGANCLLLVAVTGLSAKVYRDRAVEAGFDHFLVKPVDPDLMTDLLRDYAARRVAHGSEQGATHTPPDRGAGIC